MESTPPYADRIAVSSIDECYYYHTMDVPGHGVVTGEWDLRRGVDDYVGGERVDGRRVLEVGTASGFLCFEMEKRGAEVVAYDLSGADRWDVVPYASLDTAAVLAQRSAHITRLNKSWWFNHAAFNSRAKVVYGSVYEIPRAIGPVDVCTFGSVLLHLRDPFLALERAAALAPGTIVVTEPARRASPLAALAGRSRQRSPVFLPDAERSEPVDAWWSFTPRAVSGMLAILGYETVRLGRHAPPYRGRPSPLFTVVAKKR